MPTHSPAGKIARALLAIVFIILALAVLWTMIATATRPANAGEPDKGAWFRALKQPGSGLSCCDISDCHPARSTWHDGRWWAEIGGRMTAIPPDKVLPKASIFEDGVVCNADPAGFRDGVRQTEPTIYCFVPPPMGF